MRINIWEDRQPRDASLGSLKTSFSQSTWTRLADSTFENLEKVADALEIPRDILIGKLRSNHPHADTYLEYTKVFARYLVSFPVE